MPIHEDDIEGSRIMGSVYRDDNREFIPDVDDDLLAEVSPLLSCFHGTIIQ